MNDPGCFNVLTSAGHGEASDVASDIELLKTMRLSTTSKATEIIIFLTGEDELLRLVLKVDNLPLKKIPERLTQKPRSISIYYPEEESYF